MPFVLDYPQPMKSLLDGRLLAVGIYEKTGPTPASNASQSVKGLTDGNGTMWFLVDDDGSINSAYQDLDACCCNILYWLKIIHGLEFELIDNNDEGEQGSDSDDIGGNDDGRDDRMMEEMIVMKTAKADDPMMAIKRFIDRYKKVF